jgi:hypothetical protein
MLADAVEQELHMSQFDVSTAFLSGDLEETVFLKLPPELGGKLWRLKKALYGLKQAARSWQMKLRQVMTDSDSLPQMWIHASSSAAPANQG